LDQATQRGPNLRFIRGSSEYIDLIFKPDFDNWASPFSASDYLQAFKESPAGSSIGNPVFNADMTEGFKVTRVLKEINASMGEEISHVMSEVKRLSSISAESIFEKTRTR
jgi:hypothetical protein